MTNADPPTATPTIRGVLNDSNCVEVETGATITVGTLFVRMLGWEAADLCGNNKDGVANSL